MCSSIRCFSLLARNWPTGVRGFAVLPQRWIVERTFHRLSKVQANETPIEVVMIRLMIARQGRPNNVPDALLARD